MTAGADDMIVVKLEEDVVDLMDVRMFDAAVLTGGSSLLLGQMGSKAAACMRVILP